MSRLLLLVVGVQLFPAAIASCLTDAIPVAARKPLKGPAGIYPLGVWVNNWPAGHLVAEMMAILMEEMMGYLVELKGPGAGTPDGFFALTGCRNPTNSDDRQCEGVNHTRVHVNVEGWTVGYSETWDKIQQDFTALAPRNLGNAGYNGMSGIYVLSHLKDRVYEAAGLSLDFYRDYNASWRDLSPYFTSLHAVNTSRVHPCNATNLMDSAEMQFYLDATGDWDGVTREGSKVVGKCWQQHFWVPPACRSDISRCFVFFTGGSGWQMNEMMQKGTIHNMPMAVAVGNTWSNYASLPLDYDSVFYTWQPDTTFLRRAPLRVVFPEFDPLAWQRADRSSAGSATSIDTHVSQDLRALAPDVEELLSTYQLTLQEVNHMMLDHMDTENSTYWDSACRWVKSNRERWRDWLPDKTRCFQGFGIFDEFAVDFGFVKDRTDPTGIICQPCPPGYFSEQYQDDKGITFVCTPCPPGTSQPFGAQVACEFCNAGEHQPESGSMSCRRCDIGSYQDMKGQPACKECSEGTSTLGQGSLSVMECGCTAGSINMANASTLENSYREDQFQCHKCGEGLECPFHSSLNGLTQGVSPVGQSVPEILDGYVSTIDEPFQVFKCNPPSTCLRGKPGNCAGGLEGDLCTRCSAGQTWNGETCSKCHIGFTIAWCIAAVLALMSILASYSFVNMPSNARASTPQLFLMALGLAVHVAQSVAVFGMMEVSWPKTFENTSSAFQIFVLDLNTSTLTCLTGWNNLVRFSVSVMAFPVAAFCLLGRWALSRCFSQNRYLKRWIFPYTFNTIGVFLQAGFASVCAIALQPMMCYSHPNGFRSILKFPSTFCGGNEHLVMLLIGVVLLLVFVLGFLGVCFIAIWKLPSWSLAQEHLPHGYGKEHRKVEAFRFLTGKFRVDFWWFGVLLLLRGLLISIVIVIATDVQRAQATLAAVILVTYLVMQSKFWPWKARSINVADASLNSCLVILISQSSQDVSEIENNFASNMTISIMVLMRPEKISKALKSFVTTLAEIQEADLRSDLGTCNHYDLQVLQRALAILHSEVIKDDCWVKYQLRISARPISARPKEAKEAPKEAAPIAQQQPEDEVAKNEVFLEVLESQGVKDIENVQDVEDDVDDNGADNTSAGSAGNYEASVSPISEEKEGIIVATVL
eukprot:symbB.v1.2.022512.t1/scaffold2002.1/size92861/6